MYSKNEKNILNKKRKNENNSDDLPNKKILLDNKKTNTSTNSKQTLKIDHLLNYKTDNIDLTNDDSKNTSIETLLDFDFNELDELCQFDQAKNIKKIDENQCDTLNSININVYDNSNTNLLSFEEFDRIYDVESISNVKNNNSKINSMLHIVDFEVLDLNNNASFSLSKYESIFNNKTPLEQLTIEDLLNDSGLKYHFNKSRKMEGYEPALFKVKKSDTKVVCEAINSIYGINTNELITEDSLELSMIKIKKLLEEFHNSVFPLLIQNNEDADVFIKKLFSRILAKRILVAIREKNIAITDFTKISESQFNEEAQKLYDYQPKPDNKTDEFESKYKVGHCQTKVTDYFMLEEMQKTGKGGGTKGNKSVLQIWNDDTALHGKISGSIYAYFTKSHNTKKHFTCANIISHMKMPGNQVSHYRPTAVVDLYFYLIREGIFKEDERYDFFDSSSGWGDRLAGALFANQGKGFKKYFGFDPNPTVIEAYRKLIDKVSSKYNPDFITKFYQEGIEKADAKKIIQESGGYFHLTHTSPPFYKAKERYNEGGQDEGKQVWKAYPDEDKYINQFFIPLLKINLELLTAGGVFALHFKEELLLKKALNLLNKAQNDIRLNVEIWKTGKYYPSAAGKSESVFFFRKNNFFENVPKLISKSDEQNEKTNLEDLEKKLGF